MKLIITYQGEVFYVSDKIANILEILNKEREGFELGNFNKIRYSEFTNSVTDIEFIIRNKYKSKGFISGEIPLF